MVKKCLICNGDVVKAEIIARSPGINLKNSNIKSIISPSKKNASKCCAYVCKECGYVMFFVENIELFK